MTDFASVPRLLWVFLPCWGKYGNAAVIHDYLYWEQQRPRKEADGIFREAMGVLGVSPFKKWVMHLAVSVFGGFAWRGNTARRRQGPSRIAATMPVKSTDVPGMLRAGGG